MMSKLTEQLGVIGIFNECGLVRKGYPFIWFRPRDRRACVPAAWMLTIVGRPFKDVWWRDCGSLSFGVHPTNRPGAIPAVLAECKELFPDLEMVKGPWPNTYVPKVNLDAAKAKLKEKKDA